MMLFTFKAAKLTFPIQIDTDGGPSTEFDMTEITDHAAFWGELVSKTEKVS